ncbi:uncharacterized protein LOC117789524 [Drosophila innubila]|uniref:uncharacterized protein LOC117789524 n=1 Tax=Drosophila innubila TaxID=198719 RepID=UPI00148B7A7F|nr:uncharacterized protein LOC117789524 [Drosophila innubila]
MSLAMIMMLMLMAVDCATCSMLAVDGVPRIRACTSAQNSKNDRSERPPVAISRPLRADQNATQAKIEVLVEAASEQTATIKGMTKQQGQGQTVARKFPIQSVKDLNQMSMEINDTNRELYIDAIKIHIMHGGIMKNLKNVLSNTVVLAYNVDGVQGKAALKNESSFYGVLLDAINLVEGTGSAEDNLRKALQLQKKRYFKNSSCNKNKIEHENNNNV